MPGKTAPSPHQGGIRAFNKHILNPLMMKLAGRKYWYAAVVHHTGRRSGKPYKTPIVAQPIPSGFAVPLPYGTDVDWLRNILAAGEATVDVHGRRYHVVEPQIVDAAAVLPLLPANRRRVMRLVGVEKFLQLRTISD